MGNPLELLYSWQALLCAVAVVGLMKLITTIIDLTYGKAKRKGNKWLSALVLPVSTVLVGALWAMLVPLRPEVLIAFVTAHVDDGFFAVLSFGAWGGACGQFAQTLYDRANDLLRARTGTSLPKVDEDDGGTDERP